MREIADHGRNTGTFAGGGAALGAGLGLLAGLAAPQCFGCPSKSSEIFGSIIGLGAMGAGIGAAIGAATRHEWPIYRANAHQPAAFVIAPFAAPDGKGLLASLRF